MFPFILTKGKSSLNLHFFVISQIKSIITQRWEKKMLNGEADKYCQLAGKLWYEFAAIR